MWLYNANWHLAGRASTEKSGKGKGAGKKGRKRRAGKMKGMGDGIVPNLENVKLTYRADETQKDRKEESG